MTDEDLLTEMDVTLAMVRMHWYSLGKAIHQRDWSEVDDVFRRMGIKLGEHAESIDWTLEASSEGG